MVISNTNGISQDYYRHCKKKNCLGMRLGANQDILSANAPVEIVNISWCTLHKRYFKCIVCNIEHILV